MPKAAALPQLQKPVKTVRLHLDDQLLAENGFREFVEAAFPAGTPASAAVRELVLRGLGTDPLDAAIMVARRAAYAAGVASMRAMTAAAFESARAVNSAEEAMARTSYEQAVEERVAQRVQEELEKRGLA